MTVTFIYDDRPRVSAEIEAIIGAKNYSSIIRRRERFGMMIRSIVMDSGSNDFIHIMDDSDARYLAGLIREEPDEKFYLRYPSCYMPQDPETLREFVRQCEFATNDTFLTSIVGGEAPSLFQAKTILPLLEPYDPEAVNDFLLKQRTQSDTIVCELGIINIALSSNFLPYMWYATETRDFNSASGDEFVLTKTSDDRDKMKAEYQFFHIVPEPLKRFLVPTFDFQDDGQLACYSMERLALPDVALQTIHNAFDEASFKLLVRKFFDFIDNRPVDQIGAKKVREVAKIEILGKMNRRLADFLESSVGRDVNQILATAGPCGDLHEMSDLAQEFIQNATQKDKSDCVAIGHGDPCFSNILFDRRTGIMRLIDPRGATSIEEAWMHPVYDIAKFSHSILGGYDFVNNGLFECRINEELKLDLDFYFDQQQKQLKTIFVQEVEERGYDLSIIRAYELSLFLSMLPLHSENPRKLVGYALIASNILSDFISDTQTR